MTMASILETLEQQLGPSAIGQLSRSLGADPGTTSNAVSVALPALLGALSKNASTDHGAAALDRALDDHDGSILDNIGGFFGSGGSDIGSAIPGHVFGPKRSAVEQVWGRPRD
jgi:hypothetical protein